MGPSKERGGGRNPPAKLLRMYRHSLATLMVIGGQTDDRRAVALAFHRAGPLRRGPFVFTDCGRDESRLREAFQACLTSAETGPNLVLAAWGGTLHLDSIAALSSESQRLLLCLLDRTRGEHDAWPLRLGVGGREDLVEAVNAGRFLPALYDGLDKIRVELDRLVAA